MRQQRLVTGLVVAFGLMTAILLVGAIVVSPALVIPAGIFGVITYLLHYQASGRLLDRVYRGVEQRAATGGSNAGRGGFGAGPREEWTPPRQEQRQRTRRQRVRDARRQQRRQRQRASQGGVQHSRRRIQSAAKTLGVDPDADESTIKRAYRERIKEVHPDADSGDEEEFKRVQDAYEVLTE